MDVAFASLASIVDSAAAPNPPPSSVKKSRREVIRFCCPQG
jgi:hypothetical protein